MTIIKKWNYECYDIFEYNGYEIEQYVIYIVVNTILKRIRELTKTDNTEYKNYLEKVTILSTNRDLEENVKQGAKMLTVDIEKIPFYQDGLKDGLKKGVESTLEVVAISMLKLNVELEIIQKATGLTLEEIEKLRQKI